MPRKVPRYDSESIRNRAWENRNLLYPYFDEGLRRFFSQYFWR
jgi:hypothetical protein